MIQPTNFSEATIWERILDPERGDLPIEVARYFLKLSFGPNELERMHALAERHQQGELAPHEVDELRSYRQVGLQLDLLHSKARQTLKATSSS